MTIMKEQNTGGDVIVQILKAAGVECVFGIISIHNIPIYDAIARQGGIRTITNRSEPILQRYGVRECSRVRQDVAHFARIILSVLVILPIIRQSGTF